MTDAVSAFSAPQGDPVLAFDALTPELMRDALRDLGYELAS